MLKSMKLWLGLPCDVYSGAKTQEGAWQTQDRASQGRSWPKKWPSWQAAVSRHPWEELEN